MAPRITALLVAAGLAVGAAVGGMTTAVAADTTPAAARAALARGLAGPAPLL